MKKRITILVFVAVLFAVWALEVESAPIPAPKPQYGGILKVIQWASPGGSLGWPADMATSDVGIAVCALEPLLRMHYVLTTEPILAMGWTIAPDLRSITFTLRKGVKFHDGTDWNAEAAKFNLEALKAAKKAGTHLWASVKVIDDYTFQVNLSGWENTALEDIGTQLMVSPTAFKTMGIEKIRWNPVGTGAFTFVSHERDVTTKFKKFDGYWQKGKPYLDGIELIYVTDPMTQSAIMQAGKADVLWGTNLKLGADLKALGFESFHLIDGIMQLIPDSANSDSFFVDKRVREALEYAMDKEALVKAFSFGFWQPAYQLVPSTIAGYIPDLKARQYDPDKAKALLKEAGYPDGFKTKLFAYPGTSKEIITGIQGYLAEVGIKADIEFPLMGRVQEYRRKGWQNALFIPPWPFYPNISRTLSIYALSTSGDYVSLKRPAGLDELVKEALASPKVEPEKIQKVVRKMFDEAVTLPLWYMGGPRSLRKGVQDLGYFSFSSKDVWSPENAWLSK